MAGMEYRYEIKPRPVSLGGGWLLAMLEVGEGGEALEVGGGVFPVNQETTDKEAHADALEEAENWLSSRLAALPAP